MTVRGYTLHEFQNPPDFARLENIVSKSKILDRRFSARGLFLEMRRCSAHARAPGAQAKHRVRRAAAGRFRHGASTSAHQCGVGAHGGRAWGRIARRAHRSSSGAATAACAAIAVAP